MNDIFGIALWISLWTLFLHACTWKGMIFEGIKKFIKPEGMLYKPIYGCPICMTPWWGSLFYWLFFAPLGWQIWLMSVGMAAGLSVIYVCLISLRDMAIEVADRFGKTKKSL